MADIFISYAKKDRENVEPLARALAEQGWSVFWDRAIPGGKTWDEVIEEELDAAKCVIVVWSKISITSRWVRAEAEEGLHRNILIPVSIEDVKIPLLFRPIQSIRIIHWEGDSNHPQFVKLISDLSPILGPSPLKVKEAEEKRVEEERRRKQEKERKAKEERIKKEIEANRKIEEERKQNLIEETHEGKRPEIFICYAAEDTDIANSIHDGLVRAGFDPWFDKDLLHAGDDWHAKIESMIKYVDYFLVLNSRNLRARAFSWVNKEIEIALRADDWRFGRTIIPLKVDDSPLIDELKNYLAIDLKSSDDLTDLIRRIKPSIQLEIKTLIRQDDVKQALLRITEFMEAKWVIKDREMEKKEFLKELHLLSSSLHRSEKKLHQGLIQEETAMVDRNKIIAALLAIARNCWEVLGCA